MIAIQFAEWILYSGYSPVGVYKNGMKWSSSRISSELYANNYIPCTLNQNPMKWLKIVLRNNPNKACVEHDLVNCPTCFQLNSDRIIEEVEREVKKLKLKPVKNGKENKDKR